MTRYGLHLLQLANPGFSEGGWFLNIASKYKCAPNGGRRGEIITRSQNLCRAWMGGGPNAVAGRTSSLNIFTERVGGESAKNSSSTLWGGLISTLLYRL